MVMDLLNDTEGITGEEHEEMLKQVAFSVNNGINFTNRLHIYAELNQNDAYSRY